MPESLLAHYQPSFTCHQGCGVEWMIIKPHIIEFVWEDEETSATTLTAYCPIQTSEELSENLNHGKGRYRITCDSRGEKPETATAESILLSRFTIRMVFQDRLSIIDDPQGQISRIYQKSEAGKVN